MKIRSVIDVITNSSSEAFILRTSDVMKFEDEDVVWTKLDMDAIKKDLDYWYTGFSYIKKLCPGVKWTGFSDINEWYEHNREELEKVFDGSYSFADIDDCYPDSTEHAENHCVWYESRH